DHDDRRRAEEDRRRGRARRRAREGAQLREGALRPPAREPTGADPLRPPQGGARAAGAGPRGDPPRPERSHRRGRAARRAGSDRGGEAAPRAVRAVRGRRALRHATLKAATRAETWWREFVGRVGGPVSTLARKRPSECFQPGLTLLSTFADG